MQPETHESQDAPNPYAPPAPPTREAVRKAKARRSARENVLLEKALLHTFLLSAAAAIVPGVVGIRVPGGLLLVFVAVVGLAGAHKASSTWPRRILYACPSSR